eukprot:TRINITY_DN4960_c0_g1_i1.p1 TRINITY_DN4960_c0_g1~~TRINITY_DN4960_c0_g1_i1.p1  ORF type:complete len:442 (-),score=78.11 TRINITY_DN4960_c0_g1_i1:233-1558(-)
MVFCVVNISIAGAANLANTDAIISGKSDPYVVVSVPGSYNKVWQTTCVHNAMNPTWEETVQMELDQDDLVEFAVFDSDIITSDQLLGKLTLQTGDFCWDGLEADLLLDEQPNGAQGTLLVRLEPMQPEPMDHVVQQELEVPVPATGAKAEARPYGFEGELPLADKTGQEASGALAGRRLCAPDVMTPAASLRGATETHAVAQPGQVPIGSHYHGGILVSETWSQPVPIIPHAIVSYESYRLAMQAASARPSPSQAAPAATSFSMPASSYQMASTSSSAALLPRYSIRTTDTVPASATPRPTTYGLPATPTAAKAAPAAHQALTASASATSTLPAVMSAAALPAASSAMRTTTYGLPGAAATTNAPAAAFAFATPATTFMGLPAAAPMHQHAALPTTYRAGSTAYKAADPVMYAAGSPFPYAWGASQPPTTTYGLAAAGSTS